jgi:hypothetical protein
MKIHVYGEESPLTHVTSWGLFFILQLRLRHETWSGWCFPGFEALFLPWFFQIQCLELSSTTLTLHLLAVLLPRPAEYELVALWLLLGLLGFSLLNSPTPVSSVQPLSPNRGIWLPIPQNEIPVHSDNKENPSEPNFSKKRKRDSKNA